MLRFVERKIIFLSGSLPYQGFVVSSNKDEQLLPSLQPANTMALGKLA